MGWGPPDPALGPRLFEVSDGFRRALRQHKSSERQSQAGWGLSRRGGLLTRHWVHFLSCATLEEARARERLLGAQHPAALASTKPESQVPNPQSSVSNLKSQISNLKSQISNPKNHSVCVTAGRLFA
jgi:hypothetical protein